MLWCAMGGIGGRNAQDACLITIDVTAHARETKKNQAMEMRTSQELNIRFQPLERVNHTHIYTTHGFAYRYSCGKHCCAHRGSRSSRWGETRFPKQRPLEKKMYRCDFHAVFFSQSPKVTHDVSNKIFRTGSCDFSVAANRCGRFLRRRGRQKRPCDRSRPGSGWFFSLCRAGGGHAHTISIRIHIYIYIYILI